MTEPVTEPVGYKTFTFNGAEYHVKERFKRLKFLRLLGENPVEALSLAFDDEEFAKLEEKDLTEQELNDLLEITAKTLLGKSEE